LETLSVKDEFDDNNSNTSKFRDFLCTIFGAIHYGRFEGRVSDYEAVSLEMRAMSGTGLRGQVLEVSLGRVGECLTVATFPFFQMI
jgi:hypothetical protein